MAKRLEFFELRTAADLFRKIEDDFRALQAAPSDARLAFNFFVTVEHLPDWLHQRQLVRKHCALRVVSHLANGAKHFVLDHPKHKSVTKAEASQYFENEYVEPGYVADVLEVHLSADEAKELGQAVIDVVSLGQKVVQFWRPYVPAA